MRTIRCITATKREAAALVFGTILAISCCPVELHAQAQTGAPANTASPANSPSPSNGITSGNSPNSLIETTLFAYRALASDADAIAFEIGLAGSERIVIGSQTDVAAFTLWREIMGEADLLHTRAAKTANQLSVATSEYIRLTKNGPLLTLNVHHQPKIAANINPQPIQFDITVRNGPSPASRPTSGPITITLPDDWTNFQYNKLTAWTCDQPPKPPTCTENDTLQPGDSSTLTITPQLPLKTPDDYKFTIKASTMGARIDSWNDRLALPKLKIEKDPQQGAPSGEVKFTITVSNASVADGAGSTTDTVTVTDQLPTGWTLGAGGVSGAGWTCTITSPANNPVQIACTRSDALEPGKSYDPITLDAITTSAAPNQASVVTNGLKLEYSQAPKEKALVAANEVNTTALLPTISSGEAAVSTGVDILTNLASLFAVTQTLTPAPVAPNDAPLIDLVAGHLSPIGMHLYVPSVFVPNLLQNARLTDTYLWWSLRRLENDRMALLKAIGDAPSPKLASAGEIQTYLAAAKVLTASIDAFDNGLFGGQAFAQTSQNQQSTPNTQNSQQTSTSKGGGSSGNPTCPTCTSGTCITVNCGQSSTTAQDPSTQKTQQSTQQNNNQQPTPTPAIIPQILAADLTIRALWNGIDYAKATPSDYARIKFLSLHTLESSGTQLKKSSKIVGDHIFFSGGAVASYALYNFGGDIACSGLAYDYEGNIREKNYDRALRTPQLPAILSPEIPCAPAHDRAKTTGGPNDIQTGMTVPQVIAILGPHYRSFAEKNGISIFRFDDPSNAALLIEVAFKNGKVIRPPAVRLRAIVGMTVGQVNAVLVKISGPTQRRDTTTYRFVDPRDTNSYIEVAFKNGTVMRPPVVKPKS